MSEIQRPGGAGSKAQLFKAVRAGDEELALRFLQEGLDVDVRNFHTRGALHLAAQYGHDSLVKALIGKGATVNAIEKHGFTPVDLAAKAGHRSTVVLLREQGVETATKCSLHGAILRRKVRAVRTLLARAANVNEPESERFPLALALEKRSEALVAAVLGHKPDVKLGEAICRSPLAVAIHLGWGLPMVERLVAVGANVNCLGQWGRNPLQEAASRGARDIVAFLISRGADLNARAVDGVTALSAALRWEKLRVARDLVLAGADHGLVDLAAIGDPLLVEKCLNDGASVNEPDARGERALCAAARQGHGDVVKMLLEHGADPNGPGHGGVPLYLACREPSTGVIELLLDAGADPNGCGGSGPRAEVPLHYLGYGRFLNQQSVMDAVKLLLRSGADPTIRDNHGNDAIQEAIFYGKRDVARVMEAHVAQVSGARADALLRLDAVAERLSVDLEFVHELLKAGRLQAVELKEGVLRVSESSLRKYVNGLKKTDRA